MDPQQRILLEVTWEAFEDAGIVPKTISKSNSGVYIGSFVRDYENIHSSSHERSNFGAYSAVGVSSSILANRISHYFNFRGPSIVVDTACSSSLVGIHLACTDLLHNKTDLAVAGGVNLIFKPEMTMILCNASMLSRDGHCKTFDQAADGYVRSEGVGVVILKRYSEAIRDDDPIYCLIRGTGINQDGRTATLTTPDGSAQVQLIKQTLTSSKLTATDIGYVEAHGTGTEVGDPIEAKAIGEAISMHHSQKGNCFVGSVKSNFGHTESAAGVAGIIKTALMMKNKQIPPNLHFDRPNPKIDFKHLNIEIPKKLKQWAVAEAQTRKAAVNSFGFGGTNAHALLDEYIPSDTKPNSHSTVDITKKAPYLIPLSAKSVQSFKSTVKKWTSFLETSTLSDMSSLEKIAYSAALHKSHHRFRKVISASSISDLKQELAKLNQSKFSNIDSTTRHLGKSENDITFIFSGMGQQWSGMGAQIKQLGAEAANILELCHGYFRELTTEWSLLDEITSQDNNTSGIDSTQIAQPCIFSLQVALARTWISWGINPDRVLGHSVGEIAASQIAGIFSLKQACQLVFHRSRLQHNLSGKGKMLAIGISQGQFHELLPELGDDISIAAINSPNSVTLSGNTKLLIQISDQLNQKGLFNRFLNVDVPYHSSYMDPILSEFKESIQDLEPKRESIPFFSTVTGSREQGIDLDETYWVRNIRQPVLFFEAMNSIARKEQQTFIEVSAHPVLSVPISECLKQNVLHPLVLASLKRQGNIVETMHSSLARLFEADFAIAWKAIYPFSKQSFVRLPSYSWHHQSYWNESEASIRERTENPAVSFLGNRLDLPNPTWKKELELEHYPVLCDHQVEGELVFPLAAFIQLSIEATREQTKSATCCFEKMEVKSPLLLASGITLEILTTTTKHSSLAIHSKKKGRGGDWRNHFATNFSVPQKKECRIIDFPEKITHSKTNEISKEAIYPRLETCGLIYGTGFQVLKKAWISRSIVLGELDHNENLIGREMTIISSLVHIDACFQLAALFARNSLYLPKSIEKLIIHNSDSEIRWAMVELKMKSEDRVVCDIICFNKDKQNTAEIKGLLCQRSMQSVLYNRSTISSILYRHQWLEINSPNLAKSNNTTLQPLSGKNKGVINNCIDENSVRFSRSSYHCVNRKLDELAESYWVDLLKKHSRSINEFEHSIKSGLFPLLDYQDKFEPLILHQFNLLRIKGYIEINLDKTWEVSSQIETKSPEENLHKLLTAYPEFHIEAMLIYLVGKNLKAILQGKLNPVEILFSQQSDCLRHFYSNSQSLYFFQKTLKDILTCVIGQNDHAQTLKILEVGAGTGGLTAHTASLVSKFNIEYTFTDVSRVFLQKAKENVEYQGNYRFEILDIEIPPSEQGFTADSYDIALASSVLHTTADLEKSLQNIKSLLKPGGLLLFNEIVFNPFWIDAVFGVFEDWWKYSDFRIKKAHSIITERSWKELLNSQGFCNIHTFSDESGKPSNSIFSATKPFAPLPAKNPSEKSIEKKTKLQPEDIYLVITTGCRFADDLANVIKKQSENCKVVLAYHNGENSNTTSHIMLDQKPDTLLTLLDSVTQKHHTGLTIICVWENPKNHVSIETKNLEDITNKTCSTLMNIAKAVDQVQWNYSPRLLNITFDTQKVVENDAINLFHVPLWGARRVIVNEFPGLITTAIDIGSPYTNQDIGNLCAEISSQSSADEIAFRQGRRYENFLNPEQNNCPTINTIANFSLIKSHQSKTGLVELIETERHNPGELEVEIKVEAAALNFKDLTRIYGFNNSVEPDFHVPGFGMECSGVISKVGRGVKQYQPGDKVYGSGWNCIGKFALLDHRFVQPIPSHLTFLQAATIPISYLTAYYAFHRLTTIQKGDSVLIHSASGGVGLAAISVAKAAGARIFATAGTELKRSYLQNLGVICVGDSRSFDFVDVVKDLTNNEGLNIILNTLPDQGLIENVNLLKANIGKLIDISNIHSDSKFPVKLLGEGKSIHMFDLEKLAQQEPDFYASLFSDIATRTDQQKYPHLPYHTFSINRVSEAFRLMSNSGHIGKIVVSIDDDSSIVIPNSSSISVDSEATYLVAGGTSGFGFATAKWLFDNGARHLALVSRTGKISTDSASELSVLIEQGANVTVDSLDITKIKQVEDYLNKIRSNRPPLKGIIHSAMVLDVALVHELSNNRIKNVIDPKISGAWNLYDCSKDAELDFFILYSSINSALGFAGQFNYSAANSFLDGFAHYLQSKGIAAHSIGWSLLDDVGYFQHHQIEKVHFKKEGFQPITLPQAWKSISHVIQSKTSNIGIFPVDWNLAQKYHPIIRNTARFSHLVLKSTVTPSWKTDPSIASESVSSPKDQNISKIKQLVLEAVSETLGISQSELNADTAFEIYNFDSLMAVDLGVKLLDKLQIDIPKVVLLQDGLNTQELTQIALDEIINNENSEQRTKPTGKIVNPKSSVDLHKEAMLPSDIGLEEEWDTTIQKYENVFLTGATGFLGAYLLKELIRQSNADIFCLVRASNETEAMQRIVTNLKKYHLWDDACLGRVHVIVGDLSLPQFNLSNSQWQTLTHQIDAVYHSAAQLNFALPYTRLKGTNVSGTIEVIRLASQKRSKPLHFISTLIKLAQTCAAPKQLADIHTTRTYNSAYDDEYLGKNGFNIGYHQSKWVAEELVLEADNIGLPITIYRSSLIAGDSQTGAWNTDDYICQLTKGIISMQKAPSQDLFFDFCPVDYLSKSIVHLSMQSMSVGMGYVLKNPNPVTWTNYINEFREFGFEIEWSDPESWMADLKRLVRNDESNPLYSLLPLFEVRPIDRLIVATPKNIRSLEIIAESTTRSALKKAGIDFPPGEKKILATYIKYFKNSGFIA